MKNLTEVIDVVKKAIIDGGFDGLVNLDAECGCSVDDLAPCGEMNMHCVLGYKGPCTDRWSSCDSAMYETKEDRDNAIEEMK